MKKKNQAMRVALLLLHDLHVLSMTAIHVEKLYLQSLGGRLRLLKEEITGSICSLTLTVVHAPFSSSTMMAETAPSWFHKLYSGRDAIDVCDEKRARRLRFVPWKRCLFRGYA